MEMKFQHDIMQAADFQHMRRHYTISDSPINVKMEPYHIAPITSKDVDRMLDFLRRFFIRDEPLNVNVGLIKSDDDRCLELEDYIQQSIGDGLSLMALSASGSLIGVCLNGSHSQVPGEVEELEAHADQCPDVKFKKILRLLARVEKDVDAFTRFPDVDKFIEVKIISVDGSWRGRGVATALIDKTRALAKETGHGMIRVDCTSHFSALAVARLGFKCVYTLNYADYKLPGCDAPVFSPEHPHVAVTCYVQPVDLTANM